MAGSALDWQRGGGDTLGAPAPAGLETLRQQARDAYAAGALDAAIALQIQALNAAKAAATRLIDDYLFLGLMLYGAQRYDEGLALLRDGLLHCPETAALHENIAVFLLARDDCAGAIAACHQALGAGSDSPNVHDCLADAFTRIGRPEEAAAAGRAALEAKDRRFGGRAPVAAMPDRLPPPFNPLNPQENIISYCLWGNQPRYLVPLLENVRILPHLFPGWTIRLYHAADVDGAYLSDLANRGVQLRPMTLPSGVPPYRRLLWRFEVIADPSVARFLIRDADSLLCVKERVAIDAWLQSQYHFHAMRDWPTHTDLLLAGMWGGTGGILPPPARLLQHYTAWRVENDHVDQDLLSETVWPAIRRHVLIHDSAFTGCLGSVPFPPYGALLPGSHIGQNAFLQFTRSG